MATTNRGPGRPSLADSRRRAAIDAFLGLVAERGLGDVTLDDVARRAGMQRSVVRHYLGNRDEIIASALDELVDHYRASMATALGVAPSIGMILDYLFSPAWYRDQTVEDRAISVLFHEAGRSMATRDRLRSAYESLIQLVSAAILSDHPAMSSNDADELAYAIICLAEHNVDLQSIGFDESRARAARRAAGVLVDGLGDQR